MTELEQHLSNNELLAPIPRSAFVAEINAQRSTLEPIYYADNEASLDDILAGRCTRIKKAYKFTSENLVKVTIQSCDIEVTE